MCGHSNVHNVHNALFHACEGEFHFYGQFSHMTMPKKPLEFAHCEQREKSSLVVEMCVRKCCGVMRTFVDSTCKILFPMSVTVIFLFLWWFQVSMDTLNGNMCVQLKLGSMFPKDGAIWLNFCTAWLHCVVLWSTQGPWMFFYFFGGFKCLRAHLIRTHAHNSNWTQWSLS